MPAQNAPLLDVKQIAERLSISIRLASSLMREMHPINVGSGKKHLLLRVRAADFEAWMQQRIQQPEYGSFDLVPQRSAHKRTYYADSGLTPEGKIPYRKPDYKRAGK